MPSNVNPDCEWCLTQPAALAMSFGALPRMSVLAFRGRPMMCVRSRAWLYFDLHKQNVGWRLDFAPELQQVNPSEFPSPCFRRLAAG